MSRFPGKNLFKLVKAKCVYCFYRITVTKREDNDIPSHFIHDIKTKGLFRHQRKCIAAHNNNNNEIPAQKEVYSARHILLIKIICYLPRK